MEQKMEEDYSREKIRKYVIPQHIRLYQQIQRVKELKQKAFILLGIQQRSEKVQILHEIIEKLVQLQSDTDLRFEVVSKESELYQAKQTLEKRLIVLSQHNVVSTFQSKSKIIDEQIRDVQAKISIRKELKQLWNKRTEHQKKVQDLRGYLKQIQVYLNQQQNDTLAEDKLASLEIEKKIYQAINQSKDEIKKNEKKAKQYQQSKVKAQRQIQRKKQQLISLLTHKKELKKELLKTKTDLFDRKNNTIPHESVPIQFNQSPRKFPSLDKKMVFTIVSQKNIVDQLKEVKYFILALAIATILVVAQKFL